MSTDASAVCGAATGGAAATGGEVAGIASGVVTRDSGAVATCRGGTCAGGTRHGGTWRFLFRARGGRHKRTARWYRWPGRRCGDVGDGLREGRNCRRCGCNGVGCRQRHMLSRWCAGIRRLGGDHRGGPSVALGAACIPGAGLDVRPRVRGCRRGSQRIVRHRRRGWRGGRCRDVRGFVRDGSSLSLGFAGGGLDVRARVRGNRRGSQRIVRRRRRGWRGGRCRDVGGFVRDGSSLSLGFAGGWTGCSPQGPRKQARQPTHCPPPAAGLAWR